MDTRQLLGGQRYKRTSLHAALSPILDLPPPLNDAHLERDSSASDFLEQANVEFEQQMSAMVFLSSVVLGFGGRPVAVP